MSALDASVVNTVLPVIRVAYNAPVESIQWVATAYLLVMGGLLLTFGRLGDLRGHRRAYLYGFGVFLPSSVICGISSTAEMLIAARVFQGIGAAILVSNSPAILIGSVHPSRLGQAIGLQAAMTYLGLALGPSLGGWLTDLLGWRAIFFMNVPFGAVAFVLGVRSIPQDSRSPSPGEQFDIPGALLFLGAFLTFQFALARGNAWGWSSSPTIGLFAGSAALGYLFYRQERNTGSPMLDLSLFRERIFSFATGSAIVNYVCMGGIIFLVPFYLIQGRGLSAAKAGVVMTLQPIVMVLIAPVSGRISDRFGSRVPSTIGMAVTSAGLYILSAMNGNTSLRLTVTGLLVAGAGMAIFVTPNNSAILTAAPNGRKGIASGVIATSRLIGMATGIGSAGATLAGFVGQRAYQGFQLDRLYAAVHFGFLAAGLLATGGVFLTAARGKPR